ncbi:lysogenization protein HflD [Arenicella xantha]|uniref:High frequency lysogenization protein n=1 Tax=Arenicella xantha TaxID=644221 RepID=A0A395JH18_9GAMM|nr:DUF489 family protein [Arenicella xantha]RBP49206.1 high frequency lysogenization protein [Arenicella xantha]
MTLLDERTIALSGVLQACKLVQQLARTGHCDEQDMQASLQSVLVLDAVNTQSVFGGVEGVRTGLALMAGGIFNSAQVPDVELLRYVVSIMQLQAQLYRNTQKFADFGSDVERLSSYSGDDLVEACSAVYQKHVSTMQPQVIIQGEAGHLQNSVIPPQIRALLLAAVRASVLWQQKRGSRFRLLWERTRMQNSAREWLSQTRTH